MAVSESYIQFIEEQLSNVDGKRFKKMFGGVGIFREKVMFGLISSKEQFYLRTDGETRSRYVELGMGDFDPMNRGKGMPYHEVPVHVLEDKESLSEWAEEAYVTALRNKKK